MRILRLIALALIVAAVSAPLYALTADQKQAMDDFVIVAFAINIAQDGRIHNIRLVRCENPSDGKILTGALTAPEIQNGMQIIASQKLKTRRKNYGKTNYKALVFDKRVRKYLKEN